MGRPSIPPHQKLALALQALHGITDGGRMVVRGRELKAPARQLLQKNGFLSEILKGWYFVNNPGAPTGDTTLFYANFWEFLGYYLGDRFGEGYCLNPENSLLLHVQHNVVPKQVIVMIRENQTSFPDLAFGHSLTIYPGKTSQPADGDVVTLRGIRCMSLPLTLAKLAPTTYRECQNNVEIALGMLRQPGEIVAKYAVNALGVGRIIGGLRAIGRTELADGIEQSLIAQDKPLQDTANPFSALPVHIFGQRPQSPVHSRVATLWAQHAPYIRSMAPEPLPATMLPEAYATQVEAVKVNDAYHSLSIERHQVTPELIRRVAEGRWQPETNADDQQQRNAMAARGYLNAFTDVRDDAINAFAHHQDPDFNSGSVFRTRHHTWFNRLFSPAIDAGLLTAGDLAGYRNNMVYLQGSMHAPPHYDHVPDGMEALTDCLMNEPCAFTRAVLGHWLFGYVHPYMDGNGRMARFTMNLMLASGRYPWTIIRVEDRDSYMAALESAGVENDIRPFAKFIEENVLRSGTSILSQG